MAQQLVGVRGGYTFNRMEFSRRPTPEQQWVQGYSGGVVFRTLNTPHLGLQLELLLEEKGWHLFPATDDAYGTLERHLSLPVQSVVMLGKGRFQFVVNGGAYASYVLKERITHQGIGGGYPQDYQQQPRQDWQYGLLAGLGPAVKIGGNWLQLEGRFAFTLSNRLQPNLANRATFNVSQQQTVTVALVWLTQLGKKQ